MNFINIILFCLILFIIESSGQTRYHAYLFRHFPNPTESTSTTYSDSPTSTSPGQMYNQLNYGSVQGYSPHFPFPPLSSGIPIGGYPPAGHRQLTTNSGNSGVGYMPSYANSVNPSLNSGLNSGFSYSYPGGYPSGFYGNMGINPYGMPGQGFVPGFNHGINPGLNTGLNPGLVPMQSYQMSNLALRGIPAYGYGYGIIGDSINPSGLSHNSVNSGYGYGMRTTNNVATNNNNNLNDNSDERERYQASASTYTSSSSSSAKKSSST